jgi:CelD/BcsL family acetyltransferase involved in cellulose biosynthesis
MEVKFLNPIADPDWDRLVVSHPDCTFFHSAAWAEVLSKTYGHQPLYFRCFQDGKLVALVPIMEVHSPITGRRGVCLPFTDFCDPLMFGEGASALTLDMLLEVARERKWDHFEVRGKWSFEASAKPVMAFYGHKLDLRSGPASLLMRFKSSTRRAVRKAERSGLTVKATRTREAILQFYRLHAQTRKRHGLPPQPLSFFLNIHEAVINPGLGFVVIASSGQHSVAAAVFFRFGQKAVYKFAASDARFLNLRSNNLVMWEGIRYLAQNGAEELDFGRTALSHNGLRRFKLGYGAKEEKINYLKFDAVLRPRATGFEADSDLHSAIFGRLPLALNCLAGALIYPHLD